MRLRLLNMLLIVSLATFIIVVVLYLHLTSYDPYNWAFPGQESDLSRSLWLARRTLYETVGFVSFGVLCIAECLKHSLVDAQDGLPTSSPVQ